MLLRHDTFVRLCRARDLVAESGETALRVSDVATAVGISPFHFIRQFAAMFGETPHQYRMRIRLEQAKTLLAAGQTSVTDVCMEVGFSSLGSFSDSFSKRVGVSPSAYKGTAHGPIAPGCLSLMAYWPESAFRNSREANPNEP